MSEGLPMRYFNVTRSVKCVPNCLIAAAEEVDVLSQLDLRIEAAETLHAFPAYDSSAADKQRTIEHHTCRKSPLRAESAAERRSPRRIAEEATFVAHLRVRRITERFDMAKHNTNVAML